MIKNSKETPLFSDSEPNIIKGCHYPSWMYFYRAISDYQTHHPDWKNNRLIGYWSITLDIASGLYSGNPETLTLLRSHDVYPYLEPSETSLHVKIGAELKNGRLPLFFYAEKQLLTRIRDDDVPYSDIAAAPPQALNLAFWEGILLRSEEQLSHAVLPNACEPQYVFFLSNQTAQKLLNDEAFNAWVLSGPVIIFTEKAFENFRDWQIILDNVRHELWNHNIFQQRINPKAIRAMLELPPQVLEHDLPVNITFLTTQDGAYTSSLADGSMQEMQGSREEMINLFTNPNNIPEADFIDKSNFNYADYLLYHILYATYAAWKIRTTRGENLRQEDFVLSPDSIGYIEEAFNNLLFTGGSFEDWRSEDWQQFADWWKNHGKTQIYLLLPFLMPRDIFLKVCGGDPEKIKRELNWNDEKYCQIQSLERLLSAYFKIISVFYKKYFETTAIEMLDWIEKKLFSKKEVLPAEIQRAYRLAQPAKDRLMLNASSDWSDVLNYLSSDEPTAQKRINDLIEEKVILLD